MDMNQYQPVPQGYPEPQQQEHYAPVAPMVSDKADLLDKIKPDVIVETIRHKLMGEELVDGEWVKVDYLQEKALTKLGANSIANLMLGVSSQNVALSKLKDHEIRARALSIVETSMIMCLRNWKEYGIRGVDQFYFIKDIVFSNTLITLKQSEGAGIRRLLVGTVHESRSYTNQEKPRGEGWISGLFSRRRSR